MTDAPDYDWVDDDDLSLAETERRFAALNPQPTEVPLEFTAGAGHYVFAHSAVAGFMSVGVTSLTRLAPGAGATEPQVALAAPARPAAVDPAAAATRVA